MSSAAFFSPDNCHSDISFARRRCSTETPSSAAAEQALRRIIDEHRRRNGGTQNLRRPKVVGLLGRLTKAGTGSTGTASLIHQVFKALVLAAVAVIVVHATAGIVMNERKLVAITGTVRIGDRPLAHGILEFHLEDRADDKDSFQTVVHADVSGAFSRERAAGLPRGAYAVVVKPRRPASLQDKRAVVAIPDRYSSAASTPLSVEITGTLATLDLVVLP